MSYARISDALRDLVFDQKLPVAEALDKYYDPGYVHRSEGISSDRRAFAHMVADMRARVASGSVVVLDELRLDRAYAERHIYELTMVDGVALRREVYLFGTYAVDGRFQELNETAVSLPTVIPHSPSSTIGRHCDTPQRP
jgi:hypothetical protein